MFTSCASDPGRSCVRHRRSAWLIEQPGHVPGERLGAGRDGGLLSLVERRAGRDHHEDGAVQRPAGDDNGTVSIFLFAHLFGLFGDLGRLVFLCCVSASHALALGVRFAVFEALKVELSIRVEGKGGDDVSPPAPCAASAAVLFIGSVGPTGHQRLSPFGPGCGCVIGILQP